MKPMVRSLANALTAMAAAYGGLTMYHAIALYREQDITSFPVSACWAFALWDFAYVPMPVFFLALIVSIAIASRRRSLAAQQVDAPDPGSSADPASQRRLPGAGDL
jgi:hypothetical protein